VRGFLIVVLVAIAAPALADDSEPPVTFHKGQIGVSARFGLGERAIATYDSKYYCGTLDPQAEHGFASVCTGRTPLALGLELSYGVARHIELTVELGLGLERDFGGTPSQDGPRPLFVAPGARFFFSEAKRSKLFVQPEFVFDETGYKDATGAERGGDFGVRGLEGLWIDLHRTYGMYVYVGETLEMARWIDASFEIGAGFQMRYP
jgi:hypothetical protein